MGTISSILSLLDKEHSIHIDESIGLLGNSDYKINETVISLYRPDRIYHQYKVGDYFQVICNKGCILFDEYITEEQI